MPGVFHHRQRATAEASETDEERTRGAEIA